jgi:hypothetical protein
MTPPASSTNSDPGAWSYHPKGEQVIGDQEMAITTYPYLLLVAVGDRQPQVHAAATISPRERGVLGLRVHAHAETRVSVERRMRLLYGLEEGEIVQRQARHAQLRLLRRVRHAR